MSANGRVKPDYVWMDGQEVKHAAGRYYLDWTENGKRKRLPVGSDAATARNQLVRKQAELAALASGLTVDDPDAENRGKRSLQTAVADFLEEVKLTKQEKTWRGYQIALWYFQESCTRSSLRT